MYLDSRTGQADHNRLYANHYTIPRWKQLVSEYIAFYICGSHNNEPVIVGMMIAVDCKTEPAKPNRQSIKLNA